MRIEAIIFDLGRVLVDVDFTGLFKKYINPGKGPDFSFTLEEIMTRDWFVENSTGKCSAGEFYEKVKDIYKMDINFDTFKKEWSSIFKPKPGMEAFVIETAKRYPVGALSDTDSIHWNHLLSTYPFLKIFKQPILSFQIGTMKPAEICYQKAAESVNTPIQKCLFIDDRLINVNGALKAGMQAVQFESCEQLNSFFDENNL